mmetsp:Transcript_17523/g.38610  ORF Transcript_17523/g.38610 Transcript_17523/m.38610 type:complete len:237 (-) Transcript_17523:52-762(-)
MRQRRSGLRLQRPLASLGVDGHAHELAVLELKDVEVPGLQGSGRGKGGSLAEVIGAELLGLAALHRAIRLDVGLGGEGQGSDAASILQDLLHLVVWLQVGAVRHGGVIQAVHLIEVVQTVVPLLLKGNECQDLLKGRHELRSGRDVGVRLGGNQLLAELRRPSQSGLVQRCHRVIALVIDVRLLLHDALEPAGALAKAADREELLVGRQLLPDLEFLHLHRALDDRHGGLEAVCAY